MRQLLTPWVRKTLISISDKIVYASTPYTQMKSQLNEAAAELINFDRLPETEADTRVLTVAQLLRPWSAPNLDIARIGGAGDGGYAMALPIEADAAISIGVGPDVSWDNAIGALGIPVIMFDPTIRRLPMEVPNGTFHRIGIGHAPPRYVGLGALLSIAGYRESEELILKVDVEGAEWEALAGPDVDLSRFRQILLEIHGLSRLSDAQSAEQAVAVLQHLTRSHKVIHLHANNYEPLVRFGAFWFPNALEVTLLRADLATEWEPAQALRTHIDRPNDERVSEMNLSAILRVDPLEA